MLAASGLLTLASRQKIQLSDPL
ncbi:MAG: hypothetical protein HC899_16970 [Leptolyngbyaceae cyanobacterium SM1_4_3]|nr:hypothetical protein [Leptolyngbyaceae cyanobacterium SM1_4_3]NJN89712.1 hypothetical protein [Leptolyngbyaceae cyanobacterium SL_5_14]